LETKRVNKSDTGGNSKKIRKKEENCTTNLGGRKEPTVRGRKLSFPEGCGSKKIGPRGRGGVILSFGD